MNNFVSKIDAINEWVGTKIAWLFLPMSVISVFEVIMRYIFNRPTTWAWEINVHILTAMAFLIGGYVYLHKGHVAIEIMTARLSRENKKRQELIFGIMNFLLFALLLYSLAVLSYHSIIMKEKVDSMFRSPLYYTKVIATFGIVLFLLQIIAGFMRNLRRQQDKAKEEEIHVC
ncbi:MAG: TRAP transporter small permease subunit [Dehalococcoidales bacterium]|nr:TRAP transporter small permease subunit [Dehalococcoidales bacterium]